MEKQHFLIISCSAQGHLNPSLQLAKRLIHGGARVTFVTTARGLEAVKYPLSLDGLSYAAFSDRFDDGGNRPADVNPGDLLSEMKHAGSRSLRDLIKSLSSDDLITCLIYTVLLPWAAEVAREFRIPSAFLSIQFATTFAIYRRFFNSRDGLYRDGDYTESIESITLRDDLPPFTSHDLPSFLLPNNPYSAVIPTFHEHIGILENDPNACVLLNTFHALEEHLTDAAADGIKLIPIGPLIPSAYIEGMESSTDKDFGCDLFDRSSDYRQWLDTKPKCSVVYASFGSMVVLKEDEVEEIFHGLVGTNRPFLLVIRPPSGTNNDDSPQSNVADKMMDYYNGQEQGLIVPWCSQVEVLSHPSVGCFVTHGGWNSTLESLAMSVPVVMCPHLSDQLTNAKMVDEVWKNGIRIRGNGREEITRCVEVVMGDEAKGEEMRRNGLKWKGLAMEALVEGGSSQNNLRNFMDSFK